MQRPGYLEVQGGHPAGVGAGWVTRRSPWKAALHDAGCWRGLDPPVSSSDRAMQSVRFRKPRAEPRRCSMRPLIASVWPLEVPGPSK
ncbi:MAG: hypothetical protein AVDCRST_MAG48-673 [uncultured Friedmanniella sp.]|uniref:Uncharacterized protein n=1 Tax=uncultured Friedmanniella sp. TaxID=335381 RepID=A0A6J4K1H3_9ACTN|nr:MAG: hypothetical protein AVDCRST_MAG48-673 [uncultured Friedmanniella sp.]